MDVRTRRPRPRIVVLGLIAIVMASLVGTVGPVAAADPPERTGEGSGERRVLPRIVPTRDTAAEDIPSGQIGIKSAIAWIYDDDSIAVVGEIQNRTTTRRQTVNVTVSWYANTLPGAPLLGTANDVVILDRIAPGSVGPFVVYDLEPPTGTGAYIAEIDGGTSTTTAAGGGLDITLGASYVQGESRFFPGSVRNPNPWTITDANAMLTAYDSAGDVGEVMTDPDFPSAIGPGGSADFLIEIASDYGTEFTFSRAAVQADGYRSGTTTYVTSWSNYFHDIGSTSFRNDIIWLAETGITKGCGAGRFCPTNDVRRDEMASFLVRALGLTDAAPNAFVDDEGNTHEANIDRIAAEGITTGCNIAQKLYCPTAPVKRDQMASFLVRALDLSGAAPDAFTDDDGNTHEKNIDLLAQAGVTTGCGPTTYCPTQNVTRGQMAAFLRRAFE